MITRRKEIDEKYNKTKKGQTMMANMMIVTLLLLLSHGTPSTHGQGTTTTTTTTTNSPLSEAIVDWLPAVNAFEATTNISDLNSAYQFGIVPITYTTYYGTLAADQVAYFTFTITELRQLVKYTLFRGDNPKDTQFYPGIVLMGRDRLNIDRTKQYDNYFPSSVKVPVGYDTFVMFNNEADDFMPIYVGMMPIGYYQMLTFNTTDLVPGIYVLAIFNSVTDGATAGQYALCLGTEITLTFDDFMLGPFYAFVAYEWHGWSAALILLPYWVIIGLGACIIGHQTFYRGNSPRSWYSFFTVIGGFLIAGSGCVVVAQLAYSFLQIPSPISDSVTSVGYTVAFFIGPFFCGILIVFFGLMHHANVLVRLCVLFLAVGSCLAWASYYIGPGIAVIGALLPSSKKIPFEHICCWMKKFDEDGTVKQIEHDIDDENWDRKFDEGNTAKPSAASSTTAASSAAAVPDRTKSAGAIPERSNVSAGGTSKPFPIDEVGVHYVGDNDDETESDPDERRHHEGHQTNTQMGREDVNDEDIDDVDEDLTH